MPLDALTVLPYADFVALSAEDDNDLGSDKSSEPLGEVGMERASASAHEELQGFIEAARRQPDSKLTRYAVSVLDRLNRKYERSGRSNGKLTEWLVIHDVRQRVMLFRTAVAPHFKLLNFKDLDFSVGAPELDADLNLPGRGNFRSHLASSRQTLDLDDVLRSHLSLYISARLEL